MQTNSHTQRCRYEDFMAHRNIAASIIDMGILDRTINNLTQEDLINSIDDDISRLNMYW